jgi:phospholipid N-methyltransferase
MVLLKEMIKHTTTIGEISPFSPHVVRSMVQNFDFSKNLSVVELGAGFGAVTKELLWYMNSSSRLTSFEIHPPFLEALRDISDQRYTSLGISAEYISDFFSPNTIDHIVSTLPFSFMPYSLLDSIISHSFRVLKPNWKLLIAQYSPFKIRQFKKSLSIYPNAFTSRFVLRNIPSTFIYEFTKLPAWSI